MRASSTGSGTNAVDSDSDSKSRVRSIVTTHIGILSVVLVGWEIPGNFVLYRTSKNGYFPTEMGHFGILTPVKSGIFPVRPSSRFQLCTEKLSIVHGIQWLGV